MAGAGSTSEQVAKAQTEAMSERRFGVQVDDGERIAGEGVVLVLANGTEVRVRFGMRELRRIEERMGSIAALADAIALPWGDRQATAVAQVVSVMAGVSLDAVDQFIDPRQLPVYCAGIDKALSEAMPPVEEAAAADPKEATPSASTGQATTTSPPSPSDAPTPSSGG